MKKIIISTLSVLFSASVYAQTLDPNLKAYSSVPAVSGTIKSIGSDTLNNLMTLWAEGFRKVYPNVQIEIEGWRPSTPRENLYVVGNSGN